MDVDFPRVILPSSTLRPGSRPRYVSTRSLGDAPQRCRLDGERETRRKPAQRGDVVFRETLRPVTDPRRIHPVHLANNSVGAKPIDHGEIIGHAGRVKFAQKREFGTAFACQSPAQCRRAGLDHVIERAASPTLEQFALDGGTVFGGDCFAFGRLPVIASAATDRVQGIDENLAARQR